VELLNRGSNSIDLSYYALVFVNGANNQEYLRVTLNGGLAAGQYLVVASIGVSGIGFGARVINFASPTNIIQNGSPDGVALINVGTKRVYDSLSYAGSITAATITGFPGTFNLVHGTPFGVTDSGSETASLARVPDGTSSGNDSTDWRLANPPTPGSSN
jgi:hypothetical protein